MTKVILQDFPGPGNFQKKIQDFPGGVRTLAITKQMQLYRSVMFTLIHVHVKLTDSL